MKLIDLKDSNSQETIRKFQNQNSGANKSGFKPMVLLDVDDVILNFSLTIINMLNKKYNINPPKKQKDLKDWKFKSIYSDTAYREVDEMFASSEFWNNITIKEEFENILNDKELFNSYTWVLGTGGTNDNIDAKFNFLVNYFKYLERYDDIYFYSFTSLDENNAYSKKSFPLQADIQVDDCLWSLDSSAYNKILITNNLDTEYNSYKLQRKKSTALKNNESFYVFNTLNDLKQYLEIYKFI